MSPPALHFAHANSFPGGAYRKFLDALGAEFAVSHSAVIGSDPRYPVSRGWRHLAEQVLADIGTQHAGPVIGVGHSLGGYLMLMGALARPALFRAIVMLDAPLLSAWRGRSFGLLQRVRLADFLTPAAGSRRRRAHFASVADALLHFQSRAVFRRFDPDCLADYVLHGTVPAAAGGVRLRIDPRTEVAIYRTLPHDLVHAAPRLAVPAALIAGRESSVARRMGLAASRRVMPVEWAPGGHLFPLEHPLETARVVTRVVRRLCPA